MQKYGFPPPKDVTQEKAAETLFAFDKGLEAQRSGNNKLAVELYTKHIEGGVYWGRDREGNRHMLAIAYGNRASAYANLGAFEEAFADIRAARELWPAGDWGENEASVLNGRAIAAIKAGDFESALADFDRAVKLAPREAQFWVNRCFVAFMIRSKAEAEADCEKALLLDPKNVDAMATLRAHQHSK